jgi:hypothetical protein
MGVDGVSDLGEPVRFGTLAELHAWADAARAAAARERVDLFARVATLEGENAALRHRIGWLEAVAEGSSAIFEMRITEFRGLVGDVLRLLRSND